MSNHPYAACSWGRFSPEAVAGVDSLDELDEAEKDNDPKGDG